ncbi:glycosyltransferase family 2 protein [Nakamurella aerolata]|uniref:Glycosyltransferase family 2 protein n=1 Tax=Nakamurella aerolata TaxID=1656892 RepID=A0A849AAX2_9ACTN|nr:glycosyltransferase family 2 protein [Nakamurella aerolata]NNG36281.1 glycosyltransferase family 2 protein [Nakamurella aerolata]
MHAEPPAAGAASRSGGDVTVVVVTYAGRAWLERCLDSLAAQRLPHRLLVVDNGSSDGTAELLHDRLAPEQVLRLPENRGFAGGMAAALTQVRTRWTALLNDDAVADPDWLSNLVAAAEQQPDTAAWTAVLLETERPQRIQNAGVGLLPSGHGYDLGAGDDARSDPGSAVPAVAAGEVFGFSGGAALLRTDAVAAVGGFPAEFFLYYEDVDTSWRLRAAGWQIRLVPDATVRHAHSATADQRSSSFHFHNERNRLWFLIRNAPAAVAARGVARFGVTTGSLAAKRLLRRPVPDAANFSVALRLRVLGATALALPALCRQRWLLGRAASVPSRQLWRRWARGKR